MEFRTKSGTTTTRYLLAGNNWNTEVTTDELGNITRTYLVDPFGTFKVYTAAGADGKWFTTDDVVGDPATLEGERVLQGLPWYGSTGLYHLRNRWYSPTLQRFLSMDPLGFDAGDANLYRFEGNDPLGNLDPMGAAVWNRKFALRVGVTVARGYAIGFMGGVATLALARVYPPAAIAVGVVGLAMVGKTLYDMYGKASSLYSGLDENGRPLCPNQRDELARELILDAASLTSGVVGGGVALGMRGMNGAAYEGLTGQAGKAAEAGSEVLGEEAGAGLVPRAGSEAVPPTVGNTEGAGSSNLPTLTIDGNRMPNIASNIRTAFAEGQPDILTRTTDATTISLNRSAACRGFCGAGSPDEYPFASTLQGGAGARVQGVPLAEQRIQGGVLSSFYAKNGIGNGSSFRVEVTGGD